MGAFDQVLPGGANVGGGSVIGNLVDEETEVVVGGLIRVLVVESGDGQDLAVELGDEGGLAVGGKAGVVLEAREEV